MFVIIGNSLINTDIITRVDLTNVADLEVVVFIKKLASEDVIRCSGIQVIKLLMALKPSALEGRRLRWATHTWMVHNLIGHPLMQFLVLFKQYKLAMLVHDATVPVPLGRKTK